MSTLSGKLQVLWKQASKAFCSHQCRHCTSAATYTPRRAVLYVPGNDERKLQKIPSLRADCVVMDCEDGVAANRKDEARILIRKMLDNLDFGSSECSVRVNSMSSGLVEADLGEVLQADRLPSSLMLPKVDTVQEIQEFLETLKRKLEQRTVPHTLKLVIFVESAIGLLNLRDICQRGQDLCEGTQLKLDGIVFGSDDFCADIGATRTKDANELMYARQKVVTTAKAFRLQAIDLVHIDYKDLNGLREQSIEGAQMGFTGKQVIHPTQIPVVHEAFSPSQDKVEWATELIRDFEKHQESGMGAFTFRGKMIDKPLLLQAQNIVNMMKQLQNKT